MDSPDLLQSPFCYPKDQSFSNGDSMTLSFSYIHKKSIDTLAQSSNSIQQFGLVVAVYMMAERISLGGKKTMLIGVPWWVKVSLDF